MLFREQQIEKYFNSWIINAPEVLSEVFHADIFYSECYGPYYNGIELIIKWFKDWNTHGKVLEWEIREFYHNDCTVIVSWYFKCDYKQSVSDFEGVSIIQFNEENLITSIREFKSDLPKVCPY